MSLNFQSPHQTAASRDAMQTRECRREKWINGAPASSAIGLVLTVSSLDEDHICLRRILGGSTRIAQQVQTCRQALASIRAGNISVLICETDLPDGSWKDVLSGLAAETAPPPLIVASRLADERLWAEVLNLGGYDVLSKPFLAGEVLWAVESAHRRRKQVLGQALEAGCSPI